MYNEYANLKQHLTKYNNQEAHDERYTNTWTHVFNIYRNLLRIRVNVMGCNHLLTYAEHTLMNILEESKARQRTDTRIDSLQDMNYIIS